MIHTKTDMFGDRRKELRRRRYWLMRCHYCRQCKHIQLCKRHRYRGVLERMWDAEIRTTLEALHMANLFVQQQQPSKA